MCLLFSEERLDVAGDISWRGPGPVTLPRDPLLVDEEFLEVPLDVCRGARRGLQVLRGAGLNDKLGSECVDFRDGLLEQNVEGVRFVAIGVDTVEEREIRLETVSGAHILESVVNLLIGRVLLEAKLVAWEAKDLEPLTTELAL